MQTDRSLQQTYTHYLQLLAQHQQECLLFLQQEKPTYNELFFRQWISYCEKAYSNLLQRPEYQFAYGQLVNAWLKSKQNKHE